MTPEEILFFDKLSATWDANEVLSTPQRVRDILSLLWIKPGDRILDLGTGTGVLLPYLQELVGPNGEITAVDISEGMLGKAMEKYGEMENVRFLKLDFEKESLDGLYDVILLYCVYPHLHSPEATLTQLATRNLAEKGRIFIIFPSDEKFINSIHRDRKAESDILPPAAELASRINGPALTANVLAYGEDRYIVEVKGGSN